jgi:hypothetical protein
MKKFKDLKEELNSVAGIAGARPGEEPPVFHHSPVRRSTFAGMTVFDCDDNTYARCIQGKKKYARYEKYVGADEFGQAIREFAFKNPKKPIVLRNSRTGEMIYLKK